MSHDLFGKIQQTLSVGSNNALVALPPPGSSSICSSQYRLCLPSKEELREKLIAWAGEVGG
jgi:hypothetical protein